MSDQETERGMEAAAIALNEANAKIERLITENMRLRKLAHDYITAYEKNCLESPNVIAKVMDDALTNQNGQ